MPKLVMVVDDEEDFLYEVKKMLEKAGLEVISAIDSQEALKILETKRPDLILLDVMMPGLDGWDLAKRIRKKKDSVDIPIAMLTVRSTLEDKIVSLEDSGAVWHISKPIEMAKFVDTVKWLLTSPPQKGVKE
jgi:DNA-binding response OmpR family regulator